LPQDPDDPDVVDADEELDAEPIAMSCGSNGQSSSERNRPGNGSDDDDNDPKDDEWDVDDEEVILAASPTSTETHGNSLAPARMKQRQSSKSSVRSNRNASTLMEKVKSSSSQRSREVSASRESSSGLVATSASVDSPLSQGQTDATSPISPIDTARRDSAPTSSAGSLRRRKKRRVQIAEADQKVFPMVMSVGWNPFYKNSTKTAEVHVMHPFEADFYGLEMRVVVLGYIRPEYNYVSKEALIEDIEMDKRVAINSLARSLYEDYGSDPFLLSG
jgi:hypothetical protein